MMSWCHGWGCIPLQTASNIHIRHVQSVWSSSNAFHIHIWALVNCYTGKVGPGFGNCGSIVESKWCHYGMVEAVNRCRLLPTFILDIYKAFEHLLMLSICICTPPLHSYTNIVNIGPDFDNSGSALLDPNDAMMSWLRLYTTFDCFSHLY